MKNSIKSAFLCFAICTGLIACNNNSKTNNTLKEKNLTVLCDESLYKMCLEPTLKYDSINYNLKIELKSTVAFDCIAKLLSGDAEAIILGRDYSKREDSLMLAYKIKPHMRLPIAYDALVFYTNADNPIDTITDVQLKEIFNNNKASLSQYNSKIGNPEFVCNSELSSEYFNFKKFILKDNKSAIKLKYYSTSDSVLKYVTANKNSIGIGYLSQLYGQADLKPIAVSYIDSAGTYEYPRSVHQANLAQKKYPYIVTHFIYLFDEKSDGALSYLRFIGKNGIAQRHFNTIGIVPAFANIKLIIEE